MSQTATDEELIEMGRLWQDHQTRLLANLASIKSVPKQITDPAHKLPSKVFAIIADDPTKSRAYYHKSKIYNAMGGVKNGFNLLTRRGGKAAVGQTYRIVEGEVTWWDYNP